MSTRLHFAGAVMAVALAAAECASAAPKAPDAADAAEEAIASETELTKVAQLPIGGELALATASATPQNATAPTPLRQGQITRYDSADLARFPARTALDLIQQLPGFKLESGASVRGLLGAYGNVLVNGRPLNSKAESLKDYLLSVPAERVRAIEVMDASMSSILAYRQGLVANVMLKSERGRSGAATLTLTGADAAGGVNLAVEGQEGGKASERKVSFNLYRQSDRGPTGAFARFAGPASSTADLFDLSRDRGASGKISFARRGDEQRRLELTVNGGYDKGDTVSEIRPSAAALLERYRTRYVTKSAEVSGVHATPVGASTTLETTVLHSERRSDSSSDADTAFYQATSDYDENSSESVVRTQVTRRTPKSRSMILGVEGAFNRLDGRSAYAEGGQSVALPSQEVEVRERRGEVFARFKGPISPDWAVDLGLAFEASTLKLRGSPSGRANFKALKPDATLVYSIDRSSRIAISLSRRVSQLDFSDFVTSVGLEERTVALGAPRLEPVRRWRLEAGYNLTFRKEGALNLSVAGEHVDNPQEFIPIAGQEAPGNLTSAKRAEAAASLTLPLKDLTGISGTVLTTSMRYQHSKVTDPVTGRERRLSEEAGLKGEVRIRHDMSNGRVSWGADVQAGSKTTAYRVREAKTYSYDPYWGVDVEYRPDKDWSVRLRMQGGGDYVTRRSVYAVSRADPAPAYVERRAKRGALLGYLTIRRAL